jgi:SRSO17 transposase
LQVRFRRPEGAAALERSTTGLLTALPNKHCDTLAQAVPGPSAQRLQECLTHMPGDEEDLNRQRVQKMRTAATLGDGVLVLDATGVAKQGKTSVGVARQYAGTLGQVGHGQLAVTCGDTEPQATWPVAVRLYLPRPWAENPEPRRQARVPAAATVQTTPALALALLDQARAWGVPHRGVVADADDGDHPNFVAGLQARRARSVVGVRADFRGSGGRAAARPVQRADQRLQAVPRWPWRPIRWRHGTQGGRRQKFVAVRGWRMAADGQRHVGGWLGERAPRGQPEERKDHGSTLPASATVEELAGYAHRRFAVAPLQEEATGAVGWDQDQGRLWPGFHRHAVTVRLASSVLGWLELRQRRQEQRRGRPRDPFSPSAGSASALTAGHPSRGGPLAAPPSRAVVDDNGAVHGTLLTEVLTKQY